MRGSKRSAEQLGNTPAICRKSYINAGIPCACLEGRLASTASKRPRGLTTDERAVADLLRDPHERKAA
jgi:DNA topoisomerase IB